jgi:hypothetical protein
MMGEMADFYNEYQAQSMEDLMAYESGQMSFYEAMQRGVIVNGELPSITTWGVHDVNSLEELSKECDLEYYINIKSKKIL